VSVLKWLRGDRRNEPEATAAVEDERVDPFNPFPEPINIEIGDVIDLHTIPPKDVKRVVEEYLSEARRLGFPSVRIIHGKGIGVQRDLVRAILARMPFVNDWTDAPPDAGGLGATIARLTTEVQIPKSKL
jgi:dsDNA-specific endonuclease/ATPase MutS2